MTTINDDVRDALAEQLVLHYPDGPPITNNEQLREWMRQIARHHDTSTNDGHTLRSAIQLWSSPQHRDEIQTKLTSICNDSAPQPTQSFSLFDHPFGPIIRGEDVLKSPQRVELLRKMHVDDVAPDWESTLRAIVLDGLTQDRAYVEVVRSWYDGMRSSSMEHLSLQVDLCNVVLEASIALLREQSSSTTMSCVLVTWKDIWIDLMQRDGMSFSKDTSMRQLESKVFAFWIQSAPALVEMDPFAEWFDGWCQRMSCARLKQLDPQLVATVWHRALDATQPSLQLHSAAILGSILVVLRVSQFPWSSLEDPGAEPATKIRQTMELYSQLLRTHGDNEHWRMLFEDVIRTLRDGDSHC